MIKQLLKKVLNRQQIDRVKEHLLSIKIMGFKIVAAHPRLSVLYYAFFSSDFSRECRSVLQGKIHYFETHRNFDLSNSALLRRNTHRLEKGLIMRPRRPTFAADYIGETVRAYKGMLGATDFCSEESRWATDVLSEYFSVVQDNPLIAAARKEFDGLELPKCVADTENKYLPYRDEDRTQSSISTEQLHDLFSQRRSTRWFEARTVEDDKLDKALTMASLAPSACNRQPFQFYVMNNNDVASEVASLAAGTGGFAKNIPCLVAVVGDMACYPGEQDRHLIYIDGSLAAMQFMLALETLGLRSCPINWPDIEFREQSIAKKLQLHGAQRVVMLIAVGYADSQGMIPFSSKKTVATLRVDVTSTRQ